MRALLFSVGFLTAIGAGRLEADELKIGGADGLPWEENSLIFNALEVQGNALSALEADPRDNLLPRVKDLGGSATTSVTTAAARSNQILGDLTDGDFLTGWRVFTNPNGAELDLDMGAVFILNRLVLRRGVLNVDDRSLRGYELLINDGDSLNFVGDNPLFSLIVQDRTHGAPELDISFDPTPVRFLKLRSTGERRFQMGDMEVFGTGVTPFAHYVSKVFDLGQSANFGPITISSQVDPKAQALFSTKTGTVARDSLFFEQTGIPGEFREVPPEEFDRTLDPSYAGIVRLNDRDWSPWSPPYAESQNELASPDNRRYVQFEFRLISNGLLDKAVVDGLNFSYTVPAIADSVVGEITPTTATLGEVNTFEYHLRSVVGNSNRGFDSVIIKTPFTAEVTAVEVDGAPVNFTQDIADGRLKVIFAGDRIQRSGQQIMVRFETLLTVSGTEFRGQVGDSQSDAFEQGILAGNANELVEGNSLVVGGKIEERLLTDVKFSSNVITPNGDNANDQVELGYILLKATSPVRVVVNVYTIGGQIISNLYSQEDLSGPNRISWDARDNAGNIVPPGLYVVRLSVDSDAGENAQLHTIAVAY